MQKLLFRKHPVNQILEMFSDGFAADFEAGGHLAVFDGPLAVEQLETLDLFVVAEEFVVALNFLAEAVINSLNLNHFRMGGIRNVVLLAPGLQMLEVRHNQCGGKLLVLAHHHDAVDER